MPIIFQYYRQLVLEGGVDLTRLSKTGEFFIVSIVMVAEPLAMLVMGKNKNVSSLLFSFLTIIMLVTCGYLFCLNDLIEHMYADFSDLYKRQVGARLASLSMFSIIWAMVLGLSTIIHVELVARNRN